MTTSEATCREECPYYTSSKTKVQIANKPVVRLHKMDANLLAGNNLLMTVRCPLCRLTKKT